MPDTVAQGRSKRAAPEAFVGIPVLEIPGIATDDLDFDRVETIDRHWIINPPER